MSRLQPRVCLTLLLCLFVSGGALSTDDSSGEKRPLAGTTEAADRRPTDSRAEATSNISIRSRQPDPAADLQSPPAASSRPLLQPPAAASAPSSLAASTPSHGLMVVPPVSLMLAMPHPSGRFLMLFPMSNLVPMVGTTAHRRGHQSDERLAEYSSPAGSEGITEHPAVFAARQQILYPRRAPAIPGYHSTQAQTHQLSRDFYPSHQHFPGSHHSTAAHYHNQRISSDET